MRVLGGSAPGARLPSGGGQRRELRVGVIGVHMQLILAQLAVERRRKRTPLQEPPHETRTWVLAPQLSPGVAETSLRSGTRLEGRRPELFKSADRARTCNQTLPQSEPAARLWTRRAV
mgnify:CR=1 FL=1